MNCDMRANVVPKVENFAWRLATNALPVKVNLIRRGLVIAPGCPMCGADETREHMTTRCRWTAQVWKATLGNNRRPTPGRDITTWLDEIRGNRVGIPNQPIGLWESCLLATWFIWKARSKAKFEGVQPNHGLVVGEIN